MFILASSSPRRKHLLEEIVQDFKIVTSNIDEEKYLFLPYEKAVKEIAYQKGFFVHQKYPSDTVISADTIVVVDQKIIGKPKDKIDAKKILQSLSNKRHLVLTSYHIFKNGLHIENTIVSEVIFNHLNDELIDKYIDTGSPLDKAGAYGVQDNDKFHLIKKVNGSISNVMGFPIEFIKQDLLNNNLF